MSNDKEFMHNTASQIRKHVFSSQWKIKTWRTVLQSQTWKSVLDFFELLDLSYWRQTKNSARIAIRGEAESCPATVIAPGFSYSGIDAIMRDNLPIGRDIVLPDTALSLLTKCFPGDGDIWLHYARLFAACFYMVDQSDPEITNLFRLAPKEPQEPIDTLIVIRRLIAKGRTTQKFRYNVEHENQLECTPLEPTLLLIDREIEKLLADGKLPLAQYGDLEIEEIPDEFIPKI